MSLFITLISLALVGSSYACNLVCLEDVSIQTLLASSSVSVRAGSDLINSSISFSFGDYEAASLRFDPIRQSPVLYLATPLVAGRDIDLTDGMLYGGRIASTMVFENAEGGFGRARILPPSNGISVTIDASGVGPYLDSGDFHFAFPNPPTQRSMIVLEDQPQWLTQKIVSLQTPGGIPAPLGHHEIINVTIPFGGPWTPRDIRICAERTGQTVTLHRQRFIATSKSYGVITISDRRNFLPQNFWPIEEIEMTIPILNGEPGTGLMIISQDGNITITADDYGHGFMPQSQVGFPAGAISYFAHA